VIHVATHPDMERIVPSDPDGRLTVFQTRTSPLLKIKSSSLLSIAPLRLLILLFRTPMLPLSVAILPVAVARLEFVVSRFPLIVAISPASVLIFPLSVAILPVVPAIFTLIRATVPESAFCALTLVK
jgi:hypothetical protein